MEVDLERVCTQGLVPVAPMSEHDRIVTIRRP